MLLQTSHMTIEEQERSVCKKLKKIREQRKLSQLELAMNSAVSQNMITYIENGKRTPSLSTLLKLCAALKVNPSVLFEDSETELEKVRIQMHDLIDRFVK